MLSGLHRCLRADKTTSPIAQVITARQACSMFTRLSSPRSCEMHTVYGEMSAAQQIVKHLVFKDG